MDFKRKPKKPVKWFTQYILAPLHMRKTKPVRPRGDEPPVPLLSYKRLGNQVAQPDSPPSGESQVISEGHGDPSKALKSTGQSTARKAQKRVYQLDATCHRFMMALAAKRRALFDQERFAAAAKKQGTPEHGLDVSTRRLAEYRGKTPEDWAGHQYHPDRLRCLNEVNAMLEDAGCAGFEYIQRRYGDYEESIHDPFTPESRRRIAEASQQLSAQRNLLVDELMTVLEPSWVGRVKDFSW